MSMYINQRVTCELQTKETVLLGLAVRGQIIDWKNIIYKFWNYIGGDKKILLVIRRYLSRA